MKLKKGDEVVVLAGKDIGRRGTVSRVIPRADKVIVDEKAGSGVVPYLPLSEFTKRAPAQAPAEESQQ